MFNDIEEINISIRLTEEKISYLQRELEFVKSNDTREKKRLENAISDSERVLGKYRKEAERWGRNG